MKAEGNIVILLTGGIGSGKSLAAKCLVDMGIPVYDFDSRTKELYDSDPDLCRKVAEAMRPFSDEAVLTSDGHLDKRTLARMVFGNSAALAALEAVVHPAVLADFRAWCVACDKRVVAAESAIALTKPLFADEFDKVILITAPVEVRKSRVILRDGGTEVEVEARMQSQTPASPSKKIDFIIDNNGDKAVLAVKLINTIMEILKQYEN
ncbi:MAG: dephospho-CoA kinase [Bacteroidales bacterium]|nr:dephospho-CoA kinase [Bacteroidales bacterium]